MIRLSRAEKLLSICVMLFSLCLGGMTYCAYMQFSINERQTVLSHNIIKLSELVCAANQRVELLDQEVKQLIDIDKQVAQMVRDIEDLKETVSVTSQENDLKMAGHLEGVFQELDSLKACVKAVLVKYNKETEL